MEKSLTHWKAAHPLLFISSHLCFGLLLATKFSFAHPEHPRFYALAIIIIGLISFIMLGASIKSKLFLGLYTTLILISWGIAIHLFTQQYYFFSIPYPNSFIISCREWVIQKLKFNIVDTEANSFAKALLLGVKTDLDKNLIKAYTQLGIIHIIAISGMHIDILFKNLLRITNVMPAKKVLKWLELIFILTCVWIYTLMAFASPSIVRASIFFTLYMIGNFLEQPRYTLNSIAGGILIIILFNVHTLQNIGLQLSYAAVIGIHLFYPLFEKMLPIDNLILKWCWKNLSITMAAQLTTLPILLYHFHQISTIVLISNFVMVPLINIILYALILLMVMPGAHFMSNQLGYWIDRYIYQINGWIKYFYEHSIGVPFYINLTNVQVAMYYVLLLLIYLWIYKAQPRFLFYIIGLSTIIMIIKLFS